MWPLLVLGSVPWVCLQLVSASSVHIGRGRQDGQDSALPHTVWPHLEEGATLLGDRSIGTTRRPSLDALGVCQVIRNPVEVAKLMPGCQEAPQQEPGLCGTRFSTDPGFQAGQAYASGWKPAGMVPQGHGLLPLLALREPHPRGLVWAAAKPLGT